MLSSTSENRLAALYQTTNDTSLAWEEKLSFLLDFGCNTFALDVGLITRGSEHHVVASAFRPDAKGTVWPLPTASICDIAWSSRRPLGFTQAEGALLAAQAASDGERYEAFLGVLITVDDQVWGSLCFVGREPRQQAFLPGDYQFVELIARWIGFELGWGRKQAELVALSEWQRIILDSAQQGVIATDLHGLILNFNPAIERMLGYSAAEAIGQLTPAAFHDALELEEHARQLHAELGEEFAGFDVFVAKARRGIAEEREWTYVRKDGSRLPVLLTVTALRDRLGEIQGYLGISTDLTLRNELAEVTNQARVNELSRALLSAVPDGVIGIEADLPHRVRFLNPGAQRLLGIGERNVIGHPLESFLELVHDDEAEEGMDGLSLAARIQCAQSGSFQALVHTPQHPRPFPAAFFLSRVPGFDEAGLAVLTMQDISLRRLAERKLKLSDTVFENSAEAILICDAGGVILNVNPAFTWLTGYRPDEAIGKKPSILKSGRHDAAFYREMWRVLQEDGHWEGELWDRRKDDSVYPKWLTINAVRNGERLTHYVALFSDISERKENENRIRFLAQHDHLTGLPNRRFLEERAQQLIASERRRDYGIALMLIDLDRFKNINDTLGHNVGDLLLIEVARRLVNCVRSTDTVVRLGGDEFVILLEDMKDHNEVALVARKVHEALGQPMTIDQRVLHAPPSIGISVYPDDGKDIENLMKNADAAMYQVKAAGRNAWMFYTAHMNDESQERLRLENDLRLAIAAGQLHLFYQPQFDVQSGRITAWEALLRWDHPELGRVSPERFIPVAEDSGQIQAIGAWVLRTACSEIKRWEEEGMGVFRISVNLSAREFVQPTLAQTIAEVLTELDLAPQRLELEITESVLMADSPTVTETISRLKALGVTLALDDFGTGYSSLRYLKSFAVDRLKIDRSFVRDLGHNSNDAAIVKAVISLAEALNLGVIAEGVETEDQQDFLTKHGCQHTQGFLRGHPMSTVEVAGFLAGLSGVAGVLA
jgi:diguanylate cyclase (GGDEF)-like protein/PAS domain S-box-containing protein